MKKEKKLLSALLLCAALSTTTVGFAYDYTFDSPVYENINEPSRYHGAIFIDNGESAIVKAGTQFINNKAYRGAGIHNHHGDLTIEDGVKFDNNQALSAAGGAIQNFGTAVLGNDIVFENNKAAWGGAAIYAGSNNTDGHTTTIGSGAIFRNNTLTDSASYGGAIFVENDEGASNVEFNVGANSLFDNNSAMQGGAVYIKNAINATLADGANFTGNTATNEGGAFYNLGKTTISNATFSNNTAGVHGGAIYNQGELTIANGTQDNHTIFSQNTAHAGAAISSLDGSTLNIGNYTSFENNKTFDTLGDAGGAIYVSDAIALKIGDNVSFKNNSAMSIQDPGTGAKGAAGAAYIYQTNTTIGDDLLVEGNKAKYAGGGLYIWNEGKQTTIGKNATFTNNSSELAYGGAIGNFDGQLTIGDGASFIGNSAGTNGGAIANMNFSTTDGANLNLTNATFENNSAAERGGAIYNTGIANVGGNFINNSSKQGGAIFNAKDLTIASGSNFENNHSTITGSAISNYAEKLVIGDNVSFKNNVALIEVDDGSMNQMGTIYSEGTNSRENSITIGDNVLFEGNKAGAGAGLYLYGNNAAQIGDNAKFINNSTQATLNDATPVSGGAAISLISASNGAAKLTIGENARFEGNNARYGGAINVNSAASVLNIGANSQFINNKAEGSVGGAIYNRGITTIAEGATFAGNSAVAGGAIFTETNMTLTDATFINNTAKKDGGAIYSSADNLTLNAINQNVLLSGNSATNGSDIFMGKEGSTLALNAAEGKSITITSGIGGNNNKYNIVINNDTTPSPTTFALRSLARATTPSTGTVVINSAIQNATMNVASGTLHLAQGSALNNSTLNMASNTTLNTIDGAVSSFGNNVTLADNVNLAVDVNLGNGASDNFGGANVQGQVTITDINPLGNTTANNISVNLAEALGINPNNMVISEALQNQTHRILTPIRYLEGGVSESGMFTMAPTGNGYKDFNPAVMASPVAAQLGGYLTQLNSYDQAFRNMDMYMLMSRQQREAMKLRNKYAAADGNLVFDPLGTQYDDKAVWVRPYATFENVPLKGGPRVSNVAYGSFFGVDSDLYDLGHGWDGMLSVYAGYNGSHQAYDGIGIYQNGGTLGITGMAFKGNFFTGLTLNAGANVGEASTIYGNDNFTMLMAGIASKTGYNVELADGKFIIQPNLQLSYSFVNTFDYTNAAGVKINSDPLNAIQVEPGVKFIGNLKNGWQPYAGVSVVFNIMDKTNFHANNVTLPDLSVKPYVRYGVGVRKSWGEVCTGFLQTYFTNGGRNGVGLQAGFRFTLGKGGLSSLKTDNNIPELQKTKINLSSAR